ncbi:MAG: beta-ketoacyl synthase N-terminal-like domain-containing protein, partial [Roseimicrobium sp.]
MGNDEIESSQHNFSDWPIAVIGMACRLPGADNLDEYWQLVESGSCAIAELPAHRLNRELYYDSQKGVPGKTYSTLAGLVEERPLDKKLCPVSDELVASVDAAHLTMLEVAAAALRHAGMDPAAVPLPNTGVFIGHARGSPLAGDLAYAHHVEEVASRLGDLPGVQALPESDQQALLDDVSKRVQFEKPAQPSSRLNAESSGVAGVISQAFGFTGPYMAVDGACASSLMALALAARALHHERIDMALVGGASFSSWFSLVVFSQAQAVSATGSFPFDERADGFISSDGYAAVLIKSLPRAIADGDRVYGVIRGLGMSSDGRGKSLWAPRKEGQIEAIRRAYQDGARPEHVQYVEAHGTSTQLGDATELESLNEVLGQTWPSGTKTPVTSVKANIGHTRETAGLAGLIKTLLAMERGVIPPAASFSTPSSKIPWDQLPFEVPRVALPWVRPADGRPRCAAVDAFGIGGLNVHLVVEEAPLSPGAVKSSVSLPRVAAPAPEDHSIAIVGRSAIFAGARTLEAYWELLKSGHDPKVLAPPERWGSDPPALGGFVTDFDYDWKKHKIPPRQLQTADPLQFMLLDATEQALREAGLDKRGLDHHRTCVIVGTCFGGDFSGLLNAALRLPSFRRMMVAALQQAKMHDAAITAIVQTLEQAFLANNLSLQDETGSYTASTLASRIARTLDLMGGAMAVDAGGSSSLAAVGAAVDLLSARACDMVICAGAQRSMNEHVFERYAAQGLLAQGAPRAAFAVDSSGLVPGEGAGVVILKRLVDARRDGDTIHGIICGYGASTHPYAVSDAVRESLERAVASSHVTAADFSIAEACGLGVAHLDLAELRAMTKFFGTSRRERPVYVGSLASQIGYTQGASGMASLLKASLALEHKLLPASAGLSHPLDELTHDAGPLRAASADVSLEAPPGGRLVAGVSCLALRGQVYSVVLAAAPELKATVPIKPLDARIVRLGAATLGDLAALSERSQSQVESLFERAQALRFAANDGARLALVADSPEALSRKLMLAAEQLANTSSRAVLEEQGIYCRSCVEKPGRVAWIFSGQGSQYAGMLRELVQQNTEAAAALAEMEATLQRLGHDSFAHIAWDEPNALGTDLWRTQLSVLVGDTILHAALRGMGLAPDVIAAHSYGEYAALVAAGVWTIEAAIKATWERCEIIGRLAATEGLLLATDAPAAVVLRLATEARCEVW